MLLDALLRELQPTQMMHLVAEFHVDRSIRGARHLTDTNIVDTFPQHEAARGYRGGLSGEARDQFRFLHVSTEEVCGTLGDTGCFFETMPYAPNSPYSDSKAASDHLVRAWFHSYGFLTLISHYADNYWPYQYPEKLVGRTITLARQPLLAFGQGLNIRNGCMSSITPQALWFVSRDCLGEQYNIGGRSERRNINLVKRFCALLAPRPARRRSVATPATISATPSTRPRSKPNWGGKPDMIPTPASRRLSTGISPTNGGGSRCCTVRPEPRVLSVTSGRDAR